MPKYKYMGLRRFYDRYRADASATLTSNKNVNEEVILRDLSVGGAGVICAHPLKIYKEVAITVQRPFFNKPVFSKAKVIWCKKFDDNYWRLGLKFDPKKIEFI